MENVKHVFILSHPVQTEAQEVKYNEGPILGLKEPNKKKSGKFWEISFWVNFIPITSYARLTKGKILISSNDFSQNFPGLLSIRHFQPQVYDEGMEIRMSK